MTKKESIAMWNIEKSNTDSSILPKKMKKLFFIVFHNLKELIIKILYF